MVYFQSKEEDENILINSIEQNSASGIKNNEKLPEFDVYGTALNNLHSLFEN